MRDKKYINIIIIMMATIALVYLSALYIASDTGLPGIDEESTRLFDAGWEYSIDGSDYQETDSLLDLSGLDADRFSIRNTVPSIFSDQDTLQFHTSRNFIWVYHNGNLVYALDETSLAPIGKSPGNMPLFIPIKGMEEGDLLELVFEPSYGSVEMGEIWIGSESSGLYDMLDREIIAFVISALMVVLGIFEILFYIIVARKARANQIFHLGLFTLLAGIWSFTVLPMFQVLAGEPYIISVISYLTLYLLPIPILYFLTSAYQLHQEKPLTILVILLIIYWFVALFLQMFNLVDVKEIQSIYHILLVASLIGIVATPIYEIVFRKNKQLLSFCKSGIVLGVFSVIDLATYYVANESYLSEFFRIGVILFSVLLILDYMRSLSFLLQENAKAKIYQKLAYLDILTSLKNRTSFEQDLAKYRTRDKQGLTLSIGVFDVNDLKDINDNQGHEAGDRLIKKAAECLRLSFGEGAEIYRIGGDEFVILSETYKKEELDSLLVKLEEISQELNRDSKPELSIAAGICLYNPSVDESVDDLFKRADRCMYIHKSEMKNNEVI